ncbi:MAG: AraC family transcriptional regulator [Phormidium sp. OSCR]|nr:MAG: AraC family transcriptional regulator [Phormidium sp. OSCR]
MQLSNSVPTIRLPTPLMRPLPAESHKPSQSNTTTEDYKGSIQRWQLRPELDLMIHDLEFQDNTIVRRESTDGAVKLGISFCLAGHMRRLRPGNDERVEAGRVSFGVTHESSRVMEYKAKERVTLIHLHIQPESVSGFDGEMAQQLPVALRKAIAGQAEYCRSHSMTSVMEATLGQLLHCPYQGLTQRLYIESKALELISLCLDHLLLDIPSHKSSLKGDEIDRIFYAKDILLSRITNPPTLLELSRLIGLNDRKLKQGFRQVFGTTVFGYLYSHRMQQAQQLLLMPAATIAGVAQLVGYRSPEAFSVAFRRTFDISPKAYQLTHGRAGKKSV